MTDNHDHDSIDDEFATIDGQTWAEQRFGGNADAVVRAVGAFMKATPNPGTPRYEQLPLVKQVVVNETQGTVDDEADTLRTLGANLMQAVLTPNPNDPTAVLTKAFALAAAVAIHAYNPDDDPDGVKQGVILLSHAMAIAAAGPVYTDTPRPRLYLPGEDI